jgi:hypothetical protein
MRCTHIGIVLIASVLASQAASAADLVVIVNSANPTAAMDAKSVKAHFLKTKAAWADGETVRPVDHTGEAKQRAAFLGKVLGMSGTDVERYWIQRQYASADSPPARALDDASAIKLVKTFKGGIGFVSKEAAAAAGADVKVVLSVTY